jgi:hypothetical protein
LKRMVNKRMIKKYLAMTAVTIVVAAAFTSCGTAPEEESLSLVSLPAAGMINLEPLNSVELDHLGLGGPSPTLDPPTLPYSMNGMYWSEHFSLVEGDILQIKVSSDTPVSWFGVDWSNLDIRGILATTELDEDGRSFDPQYPVSSTIDNTSNKYSLVIDYKILTDTECVLVLKNNRSSESSQLSVSASLRPQISVKRILNGIPILNKLTTSEDND